MRSVGTNTEDFSYYSSSLFFFSFLSFPLPFLSLFPFLFFSFLFFLSYFFSFLFLFWESNIMLHLHLSTEYYSRDYSTVDFELLLCRIRY